MILRSAARSGRVFLTFSACVSAILGWTSFVASAGAEDGAVPVRYGEHPGFGRMVFDVIDGGAIAVDQSGQTITVHLNASVRLPTGVAPHNFRQVTPTEDKVVIQLIPDARLRRLIVNGHLVLDAVDEPSMSVGSKPVTRLLSPAKDKNAREKIDGTGAHAQKTLPTPAPTQNIRKDPTVEPSRSGSVAALEPAKILTAVSPLSADGLPTLNVQATTMPLDSREGAAGAVALVADASGVGEGVAGHLLSLPFAATVGVAAFRRGGNVIIVFDERKPIDLESLKRDAVFGSASVQLLPTATMLTLPLPMPIELRLDRHKFAWAITVIGGGTISSALKPIQSERQSNHFLLKADQPGLVILVPDPNTGGILQVGTQRLSGQGILVERHTPDFGLLPTWQGVAVEPLSDAVSLRRSASGFVIGVDSGDAALSASPAGRASSNAVAEASSKMSRIFDLPNLSTNDLLRHMQEAVVSAAALPLSARGAARRGVAESMLSLGMGAEAQSVLELGGSGNARSDQLLAVRALSAVASLLAGRIAEADGMDDHELDGSDEIAFWRALKTAISVPDSAAAAAIFANTMPLLLSYPAELQHRLKPIAAETMAQGGQLEAAQRLIDTSSIDPALGLAQAFLEQAKGNDPAKAISMYQELAQSPNRLAQLRGTRAGAELRLATGRASASETADVLGKSLFAWRGDEREIELRMRIAELQAHANRWRPALQLLRETERLWPDHGEQMKVRLRETFAASFTPAAQAQTKPFDLVAMAEENVDLMPDGEVGMQLAAHVIDALTELDLPGRAVPYLEKMTQASPKGVARATFGSRLAQLRMQQDDPGGAIAALTSTAADSLPPELLESRTLTFATSIAQLNDLSSAANALRQLDTASGDHLLADLSEKARSWPEAVIALRRVVARDILSTGPYTAQQGEVLLRFASAASMAGDAVALAEIRERDLSSLPAGKTTDLLKVLMIQPIVDVADLPRAAREMALARSVPPSRSTTLP